jgi:ubiquitin carboxyl-terminal hydrolase 25/28
MLMKKEHQTNAPISSDEVPGESTEYKVAAFCSTCLHHFDITVDFWQRKDRRAPCHLSDESNPLHHLRVVKSTNAREYREKHGVNKYDTVIEAHRFVCSGEDCPLVVDIKISPPRLSHGMLSLILDTAKMDMRGRREIKNDPDRYQGLPPVRPLQALGYLRQYLQDAKGAKTRTELKKIARRNKKYMLAFADECDELFEYLDFVAVQEDTPEPDVSRVLREFVLLVWLAPVAEVLSLISTFKEPPNCFWQLPIITDVNRNFIEDVLYEIDVLIVTRPSDEGPRAIVHHMPALKDIERSLGCFDYPTRSRTVDLSRDEHPCYISLGAVDNFTDGLLNWAYDRQCACDPSNKPYYLDCLADLATGRESSDLQMKVVMATSAGELGQKAIEGSYRYFNLDPDSVEGDDHIMGLYKSRIESAPRQKDEARECLRIIAKHRNSEKIDALANDKTMSFEEALEFLSVSADTASDSIEAVAVAMVKTQTFTTYSVSQFRPQC